MSRFRTVLVLSSELDVDVDVRIVRCAFWVMNDRLLLGNGAIVATPDLDEMSAGMVDGVSLNDNSLSTLGLLEIFFGSRVDLAPINRGTKQDIKLVLAFEESACIDAEIWHIQRHGELRWTVCIVWDVAHPVRGNRRRPQSSGVPLDPKVFEHGTQSNSGIELIPGRKSSEAMV